MCLCRLGCCWSWNDVIEARRWAACGSRPTSGWLCVREWRPRGLVAGPDEGDRRRWRACSHELPCIVPGMGVTLGKGGTASSPSPRGCGMGNVSNSSCCAVDDDGASLAGAVPAAAAGAEDDDASTSMLCSRALSRGGAARVTRSSTVSMKRVSTSVIGWWVAR